MAEAATPAHADRIVGYAVVGYAVVGYAVVGYAVVGYAVARRRASPLRVATAGGIHQQSHLIMRMSRLLMNPVILP
jgi:hypothetical protein